MERSHIDFGTIPFHIFKLPREGCLDALAPVLRLCNVSRGTVLDHAVILWKVIIYSSFSVA